MNRNLRRVITSLSVWCSVMLLGVQAMAQGVSGTVSDAATGELLPGVSVTIEGTSTGTITDMMGKYSINAAEGQKLMFSLFGYQTQVADVTGKTSIPQVSKPVCCKLLKRKGLHVVLPLSLFTNLVKCFGLKLPQWMEIT